VFTHTYFRGSTSKLATGWRYCSSHSTRQHCSHVKCIFKTVLNKNAREVLVEKKTVEGGDHL